MRNQLKTHGTQHTSTILVTIKMNANGNNAKVNLAVQFESIREEKVFRFSPKLYSEHEMRSWHVVGGCYVVILYEYQIVIYSDFVFVRNQITTFPLLIKYSHCFSNRNIIDGGQMTSFHPIHALHVACHSRCPAIGP